MDVLKVTLYLLNIYRLCQSTSYTLGDGCLCELDYTETNAPLTKNPRTLTVNCFWPKIVFLRESEKLGYPKSMPGEVDIMGDVAESNKYINERLCNFESNSFDLLGININCVTGDKINRWVYFLLLCISFNEK